MKLTTSIVPELVWYKCYSSCTIKQALLHALQNAKDNLLTLPDIWRIKVNWNRLLGSYWDSIRHLRKEWFQIETKTKLVDWIMCSTYTLKNPTHNPDESELFNQL